MRRVLGGKSQSTYASTTKGKRYRIRKPANRNLIIKREKSWKHALFSQTRGKEEYRREGKRTFRPKT